MGHRTASCAVSGLPIRSGQKCVVIVMTPEIGEYKNSGVYNYLNLIHWRKQDLAFNSRLIELILKDKKEKGEEITDTFSDLTESKPLFVSHKGIYNEYGSLNHLDRDEFGGDHLFVHGDIWDFIQTTYPEWKKKQWYYNEQKPMCEIEILFGFCMVQRIELVFGPPILGAQDWEPEEYEYKAQFLEMAKVVNDQMKDHMVEGYDWYSKGDEE